MDGAAKRWTPTACVLCSLNCGLEVVTGRAEGPAFLEIRGDRANPKSRGYHCEKARRIEAYQTAADRLTSPLRRKADGSYEEVSWEVAIEEVAARLQRVAREHGGERILFYGGGGQGNHLGGTYCDATLKALGVRYRSNALAQEKTGEFWVGGKMFGAGVHGDFEHAEVCLFIGKNPWHSHGFPRSREVLNAIRKDPERCSIVIDPRRTETASRADLHLQLRPGTDAWCLAALAAVVVQEGLEARPWLDEHTTGFDEVAAVLRAVDVAAFAAVCDVPEELIRTTARRIASASSVAAFEDLGLQMNRHSTLGSYLQRLVWLLCGHFGRPGANNAFVPFLSLNAASKGEIRKARPNKAKKKRASPVTGSKIIIGLIPCNVMAEEILSDHPDRFRAMVIESGNPVHSVADSPRMREAMRALDFSVVVDVAFTETAREADYVLPAASQFEKAECTFFTTEFPDNVFHLRRALFEPRQGTLPEAEIHARLVERIVGISERHLRPLRWAARLGRPALGLALAALLARHPKWFDYLPVLLYRALGPRLPEDAREGAVLWALCHLYARNEGAALRAAGYRGPALVAAERLFDDVVASRSGVVFASAEDHEQTWRRIRTPEGRIQLAIPELLEIVGRLGDEGPEADEEFPLALSAGERRSSTSNTIVRDPTARPRAKEAALRVHPDDAERLGLARGDRARLSTRRGSCEVGVAVTDTLRPGHVSLPNGYGLEFAPPGGQATTVGVAPNELTSWEDRDPIAGTPWHKSVPARLERVEG